MPKPAAAPFLSCIVARSTPRHIIGIRNGLPWRMSSDLRRFKAITTGHVVVMGRGTYESIGRPLPGRDNIVLSRSPAPNTAPHVADGTSLHWVASRDEAVALAARLSADRGRAEAFVIGGASVYAQFRDDYRRIYLTEVETGPIEGDAFFTMDEDGSLPEFSPNRWTIVEEERLDASDKDEFPSRFAIYEKVGGVAPRAADEERTSGR